MHADALKGHLDLLLLSLLEEARAHGYGLVEALRGRSDGAFDLGKGTMYPALYRLERRGLVTSSWEIVDGRRRRIYRLTKRGRDALVASALWRAFSEAVEAVVS